MRRRRRSSHIFGTAPVLYHARSQFDLSHSHKTAFSAGSLIPIYLQEVLPGDTFKVDMSAVFRTPSPFLRPVMDNAFLDVFFYYVPNRILFDDFERVFGSDSPDGWTQPENVSVPSISRSVPGSPTNYVGTLADYFGIPLEYLATLGTSNSDNYVNVSALPFRAYAKIYNDWFRDENLVDPVLIQTGTPSAGVEQFNYQPFSASNYTGMPAKISKVHDYFTQLLPAPQKGGPVNIPLTGNAPVVAPDFKGDLAGGAYLSVRPRPGLDTRNGLGSVANLTFKSSFFDSNTGGTIYPLSITNAGGVGYTTSSASTQTASLSESNLGAYFPPFNGYADLSDVTAANINDLRFAFQLQRMLERDARTGNRFKEYLMATFGVSSPDSRLQMSEYIGGAQLPMSIFQVNQTSGQSSASESSEQNTPLATVGAYSLSNGRCRFSKSFVEHGFIIGVCAIRQRHTYQQGIEKFWTRKDRTDYYDPIFMNIGEQPVMTSEIFGTAPKDQIFGYNPAWEDYRYRPNRVSGAMRTSAGSSSMDIWTFSDYYQSAPILGQEFIEETPLFIDRTLSVPSTSAPQFIADFYFKCSAVRCMPTYSVPGLIDHH